MDATTATATTAEQRLLDEEFAALERALERKRHDDARQLSPTMVGQDVTLELADGRLVRGFLDRCEGETVKLSDGPTLVMNAVRGVIQHPKTLWA
jgi:hypothetical protein